MSHSVMIWVFVQGVLDALLATCLNTNIQSSARYVFYRWSQKDKQNCTCILICVLRCVVRTQPTLSYKSCGIISAVVVKYKYKSMSIMRVACDSQVQNQQVDQPYGNAHWSNSLLITTTNVFFLQVLIRAGKSILRA